jgi:hypothetical protein
MRLMQVHRKSWKTDVAMLLTLVMLFSPILSGLDAAWLGVATKAAAQQPSPTPSAVQPILVVPLKAAEGVPANIAGRMTYALISELTASKRYSPTRLSVEDPTVQRLISEKLLSQDAVAAVIEEPTPEGIAEIAAAMKIPAAAYGTVDSYTYDPSNGGSVKVRVTVRVLTIDLETVSVVEEKTVEITEEGSSAPKLKPTPEDTLAAEAIYDAAKKIVAKLIGLPPKPPVVVKPPPAVSPVAFLLGALVVAAALSGARGKAGAVPLGPADAPRSVTAVPQVDIVVVSWQPPTRGTPVGYHVYRQTVDLITFQPIGGVERLTTDPVRTTIYEDRTAQRDRAYIYSVSAVYSDGRESVRISANLGIISPTQPAPVGIGVPLPPANLAAQARDAAVLLTWTDLNPAGLVIGYRIYRNGVQIADETTVRTTTYMDRGLQNNVAYQYFVRAVSSFGLLSAPSATVTATPGNLPPQAPLNLTARFDPTTKTVTLTWQAPPDPDVAYYEVARVVVPETRMTRGLIERARQPVPTPSTSPTIIQRVLQANPRMRQQAGSEFDANVIASDVRVTTYIDSVAAFMPTPANALTRYQHLRYAVRAVDTNGQKGAWSNVVQVTPNTPPPALMTPPRLIPGNGQIVVDLQPLLEQAQTDPEWQIDKAGVRIFRVTVKGGTSATTLRPIHPEDVLPIPADGKYVDRGVVNGTRYFYAVELVDKLGVPGKRSPEAVATPFATATITITSLRRELSGNGQDSVQLTIAALDAASRPVAGLPLKVTLQGVGTLTINPQYDDPYSADPSDAITDENGQVIATYQTAVISADTTVTITAASTIVTGVSPAQLTLTLRAPVVASVEIQPQQTQLVADGQSFTRVTITVRDRLGSPMPNQTVALSVSPAQGRFEDLNGNPITQVSTGTTGTAEVIYRSGTRAGSVTLTASVGAISGQAVITLIPGSPATIELVATPTSAPADGQTEIRVTATVRDANGNAVPNVQVDFSSIPPLKITSTRVTTDSTGQATTSIIAPTQSGTYTLVAKAGAISKSISLEFLSGAASTIALSAERTQLLVTLPARYGSTDYSVLSPFSRTIITAAVRDENGNPVRGAVVQFQTNYGIIQATATTNDQGVAQAVFNAPSIAPPGSVTITAQSGGATASLDLTVIPGPPAKVRMSAFPLALPADGRTRSQLQIEVRDANDNLVPDGTQVELTLNPERFGSIQSPVATVNGIAASVYIPSTQTGEVTITAVAKRSFILDGQEYRFATDPNDPYSTARVRIFVGAQIQIVRTAPNFRTEISVSSSPSTDPAQRKSLRTRSPIENTSDLTLQLVDGQGNNIATSGVQIRVRANDSQVLLVEMQGGQETGNLSLQELTVLTDSSGRASVRYYASPIAGNVQVTAELLDPQGVAFTSDMITITQRPGDPAIITVPTPSPNLIFVPGAGTPIQTTITAQVFDSVNNPVESGISVRFEATLAGRSVGIFTPSAALTDSSGRASTTLTSTPDTGIVTVTATASVAGQQRPATGSTTVGFVTGVTAISVTAQNSYIGGAPDDNIPDSTVVTAQFTGAIPDGTRVIFSTTRGTFDPQSPVPIRQKVAAVTRNTAQVTLYAEVVTVTTIANVSVSVLDSQGQTVTGRVDVNIVPEPGPVILEPIQVARDTLVVSTTNSTNPNQRLPLDPNLPNSTTVTVSVREQGTNRPVQNAVVTLSSDDPNTLWVVGNTAKLTTIQVVTDSNGQGQASFYASTKARKVTITAEFDPGTGIQRKTATINQVPGPALLTVRSNFTTIFVRLPDTFTTADGQVHNYANLPGNSNNKAQITAVVADANGNPYADITVTFSATDGVVAQSAVTDSNGEAVVDYSPPVAIPSGGQVTIVAQATVSNQTLNNQTTLQVRSGPPAIVQIASNPTELPADGTSTAVVTATVQDANGNLVRDGVSVELKLTSRPASDTKWLPSGTDTITLSTVNGQVSAILVAGLKAGVAAVRATASEIAANTTYKSSNVPDLTIPIGVQLQPIQIDQTKVFVSKDENGNPFPPRDGFTYDNDAVVKVKVQTPQGQGVENATVVLTSSDPNTLWRVGNKVTKQTVQVLTDLNGEAQATFLASQRAGTVTITASVGPQSQQMTIVQQVGPPVVRIVANPAEIFVRMVSAQYDILPQQSQIVVSVSDPNNNPHPNAAVQLTASAGTLSATSGQTNANGQFIVTLTAPNQPTQISLRVDSAVTERGERPDPNDPRNKFTETVTVNPGPPTLLALSADRLVVQANESAIITATVQDPNGNPVRDGINVTFRLTAAPEGTSINPTSGTTTNGQASTTLTAGNVAGTATIEAEAVDVVVGHFFRATNRLNIAVGVTVALQRMEIITKTLVVSDTDATDPALRKPLDPNKENKTIVRVQVSGTSGLPIPVILDSSDSKSLWVDRRDTTRRALKQITLTVDANGEAEAIFYASTTRALSNNPVTIRVSLDPTFPANQTLSDTIVQEPGPPSKIALTLTGFSRAADGTPYLTIPSTGTVSGTFTATVTDANNNGVPNVKVKFALTPDLGGDEGTLSSSEETTDIDGKTPTITLTASNFSTEVTLTATADGASTSQKIRYSVSLTGVSIVGNPPQIPDDGVTTSTIVITGTPAFRQGLKFKLSADLGSTLTADGVTDARSLTVIVGNNNPAGEGSNEARAILKGPQPDLSQTTNRTITITATLIVDGTPRDFTGTITLLPRIQIVSDFGLSNNPNQLVVSSSNDLNPANRISLDGVVGHNKAKLQVIVNGAAAPNPRLVVISSTDGSVLFEVTKGDNVGVRNLGNISGNLVQEGERWIYEVTLYSSTLASPSVIVNFSVLGVNRNITYEQLPGLPAQVTVLPERFVIGVTGHPSLPTSTNVQAIVRDAVGNLVTTPGVTVYFTADAGLLNPPSAPAIGGYAMTTLTSTNETRQVRVFARAVAPSGAEAIGVSTVVFAVGQVNIIELRADRPADLQGNIPVPAGEIVRITAIFSPSGQVPDNVRVQVSLVGAYGIVQSVSPTLNDRTEIVIVNNNTNDFDSNTRVRVYVYEQTGQLIASPEMTLVMKGVTTPPVVSLATDLGADNVRDGVPDNNPIVVSNTNDTNKTLRSPLPPHAGGPSVNVTTLILTVRGLSDQTQETVEVSLQSTDPNGLFVFPTNQNTGELGKLSPRQIQDNSANDRDPTNGVIQVTVEYYASRKAQTVIINAEVKRGDQLHGRASITVVQDAGRVEKAFFTVDPPRLAVNTLLNREPVEARLIATLLDANDNPVPNERVSFAIEPIQVVPYADITAGNRTNVILTRYDLPSLTEVFDPNVVSPRRFYQTLDPVLYITPLFPPADGVITDFIEILRPLPRPGSVIVVAQIRGNTVFARDDGNGNISGPYVADGSVDYDTGAIAVSYEIPPDDGTNVYVIYENATFTGRLTQVPVRPSTIIVQTTIDNNIELLWDTGGGTISGNRGSGTIDYNTGDITVTFDTAPDAGAQVVVSYESERFRNAWSSGGVPFTFAYIGRRRFVPPGQVFDPTLESTPSEPPLVSDGSIYPQSEGITDANGVTVTFFRSFNVSQPVRLKMVPQSRQDLMRRFDTFYYVPVQQIQYSILQGGLVNPAGSTFTIEFRFFPSGSLPVGSRVWVRIHGFAYDWDEDHDGKVNEDPPGTLNPDDDFDGRVDEDPNEPQNPVDNDGDGRQGEDPPGAVPGAGGRVLDDDDGDGIANEDLNPMWYDVWFTVEVTEPDVIRLSITNSTTGPDWVDGWKVIQVFVWNKDGIRLMAQTSAIEFH